MRGIRLNSNSIDMLTKFSHHARKRIKNLLVSDSSAKSQLFIRQALASVLLILLTACQTPPAEPPAALIPSAQPKVLATVFLSPTPDDEQRLATQRAQPAPPTATPTLGAPTATVYIGVFLGEADLPIGGDFPIDPNERPAPAGAGDIALQSVTATPVVLLDCDIQPDEVFGDRWRQVFEVRNGLGCPIEPSTPFTGRMQIFERGVMYNSPGGQAWAIAPDNEPSGLYWFFPDAPPPQEVNQLPPENLRVPSPTFGAIWLNAPGVSGALGFARLEEQRADMINQRFANGALLYDTSSGQLFALIGDNTAFGPY